MMEVVGLDQTHCSEPPLRPDSSFCAWRSHLCKSRCRLVVGGVVGGAPLPSTDTRFGHVRPALWQEVSQQLLPLFIFFLPQICVELRSDCLLTQLGCRAPPCGRLTDDSEVARARTDWTTRVQWTVGLVGFTV